MRGKRYSTEQIIVKLREAEIEMGRGVKVSAVYRKLGISEQTFCREPGRYGGRRCFPRWSAHEGNGTVFLKNQTKERSQQQGSCMRHLFVSILICTVCASSGQAVGSEKEAPKNGSWEIFVVPAGS